RVAIRRAAHQLLDKPTVFDDPLAVSIVGAQAASDLRKKISTDENRFARGPAKKDSHTRKAIPARGGRNQGRAKPLRGGPACRSGRSRCPAICGAWRGTRHVCLSKLLSRSGIARF